MKSTHRRCAAALTLAGALASASPAAAALVQASSTTSAAGCMSQAPVMDSTGTIAAFQSDCNLASNNSDRSIEIFRATIGSAPVQVTSGTNCSSGPPVMSSDGKRIAFASSCNLASSNADGNFEIFVWNDGSMLQMTNTSGCDNLAPSINGAGTFVAFDSTCNISGTNNDGRGSEIFRVSVPGGTLKRLTTDATGDCDSTSASIDASGALVAFDSDCDLTGENEANAIQVFTVTSNGVVKQKTASADDSCSALRPSMDAAGAIIAFHSDCDFTGGNAAARDEIFTVDATGVRQVTTAPNGSVCSSGEVHMASSGTALSFTSYCKLNNQNADGSLEVFQSGAGKYQGGVLAVTGSTSCTSFAGGMSASGTRVAFDSDCDLTGANTDKSVEVFRGTACVCGAPVSRKKAVSSDALFVLKSAVGTTACNLCECDVNGDAQVSATDALRVLRVAVGQNGIVLNCPAP